MLMNACARLIATTGEPWPVNAMPEVVDPSYTYTNIDVVGGAEYFVERPQFQVEVKRYWRPSRDGRLLRVILTKDKP